jgi:hypothetical protein
MQRIFKTNPVLTIVNSYLVDSPQPSTISYLWNFGSLLGLCLVTQLVTGIILAMHYNGTAEFSFSAVEHIMRDVDNGWLLRICHANMASFFFICVYAHISRGLYYTSYRSPRIGAWVVGTIIFFLMMATAFLGYKNSNSPKWLKIKNNPKRNYSTGKYNNVVLEFLKVKKLKPVFQYEDLHLEDNRKMIQTDTNDLSGIYLILNKITKDYYIGSAATGKIYSRFSNHLINRTGSKIVKLAVSKYGIKNFAFLVLELFPHVVNKVNNKDLLNLEDFYLKTLLPNYNILTEAGNTFGYKHTEINRLNIKAEYSQDRRDRIIGKEINKKPEEALLNIFVLNFNGTVYGKYSSIKEAAEALQCEIKTIQRVLNTEKKILRKRWIIKLDYK